MRGCLMSAEPESSSAVLALPETWVGAEARGQRGLAALGALLLLPRLAAAGSGRPRQPWGATPPGLARPGLPLTLHPADPFLTPCTQSHCWWE